MSKLITIDVETLEGILINGINNCVGWGIIPTARHIKEKIIKNAIISTEVERCGLPENSDGVRMENEHGIPVGFVNPKSK
jgi:hypothetical protein